MTLPSDERITSMLGHLRWKGTKEMRSAADTIEALRAESALLREVMEAFRDGLDMYWVMSPDGTAAIARYNEVTKEER